MLKKVLIFVAIVIVTIIALNFIVSETPDNMLVVNLREVNNYSREDFYVSYKDFVEENQQGVVGSTINNSFSNTGIEGMSGSHISGELMDFVYNAPLDFSTVSTNQGMQQTLKGIYYTLSKDEISDIIVAGVMGNIVGEGGKIARFEVIPYGATRSAYYRNSWQNAQVYNQFPKLSSGQVDAAHEYSTSYSGKQAFKIEGLTWGNLKTMFGIRVTDFSITDKTSIFGYGPFQATDNSWHDAYLAFMEEFNISDDTIVTEDIAFELDMKAILSVASSRCVGGKLPYRDDNGNLKNTTYIKADRLEALATARHDEDTDILEVRRFAAFWVADVERPKNYKTDDSISIGRGDAAVECYKKIQEWKNSGYSR